MTGPEHFQEAEHLLDVARIASDRNNVEDAAFWQREAQVHATLAAAAATALNFAVGDGMPRDERAAWRAVAATKPAPAVKPVEGEAA